VDSDFLLLELREIIKSNKKIKIILMSATINQKVFSEYFHRAPVIEIPGRTYPVERSRYLFNLIKDN
jgi:ATP-dependent RNA helicase DHX57